MLDIGTSDLIKSNVNDMKIERSSFTVCEGSCTPLSNTCCDAESLHAASMVDLGPSHQECNSSDASRVAREFPPSKGGRDVTSLNVNNDVVGDKPDHAGLGPHDVREVIRVNPLGEEFELHKSSPYVV